MNIIPDIYLPEHTTAEWQIYTPCANAPKGKGGKYRRPVNVWVVLSVGYPDTIRGRNLYSKRLIANNVDSRYNGHRSAYGQALESARQVIRQKRGEVLS